MRGVIGLVAALGVSTALAAGEAGSLIEAIRDAQLDPARAVAVDRLIVDVAFGELELARGTLIPARPLGDRPFELVFVGDARLRITAPDAIEEQQILLFAGETPLDVEVEQAVLVIGDPEIVETLLSRQTVVPAEATLAAARTLFAEWVAGAERRGTGAAAGIFRAALGDTAYRHYFSAWLDSPDVGRLYYISDPGELEQVSIGQFVPLDLDDIEQAQAERWIRKERQRGRSVDRRLGDIGDWDTWMRSSIRTEQGLPKPGAPGFEPRHYTIEATVNPADQTIDARATLQLAAEAAGRRVVALELFADLVVREVRDGDGGVLEWMRSGSDLYVVLPTSQPPGAGVTLQVAYAGVLLDKLESGIFSLRDTFAWYPHAGSFDRATYDLTLRYPRRTGLLASGRIIDSRIEDGWQVEHRKVTTPTFAVSFEIGAFEIVEVEAGHVALTVGFSKNTLPRETGVKQEVVATLQRALTYYEETFGPYPLDHLTVATVPRSYSQGFLSFLTLTHFLLVPAPGILPGASAENRLETIAHELAHQWWGNQVGWYNYRDQWLSEALADYSAILFARTQQESEAAYLTRHARGWQSALGETTVDGRPIETLGPVVLGERLYSSQSSSAYPAIVYDKGSIVFTMLARLLGEKPFNAMLRDLVLAVSNRAIDTATFLRALEQMSGTDLEPFARQFVYGTGVPEVYYTVEFRESSEGKWVVRGSARQVAPARYRYRLVRTERDTWDVERDRLRDHDVTDWTLIVPFQIQMDAGRDGRARGLGGDMTIRGGNSAFEFPISGRPLEFWLDQRGQVLARFYSESREPKKMMRYRAMEAPAEEAEALYRSALALPYYSERQRGEVKLTDRELEQISLREDARIWSRLTRILLDRGDEGAAREALRRAEELLPRSFKNDDSALREFLACRFNARDGDYRAAYDRLSSSLRLRFPRSASDTAAEDLRRRRWREGRNGDGEDYALLAAAAFEMGREVIARRALEAAEERGADMQPLRERLNLPAAPRAAATN